MKKITFLLIILLTFLTGCSTTNVDKTEKYEGVELRIGIVGEIPEIRESQIKFEEINFDSLRKDDFDSKYDAIFITKENLSEASDAEYAPIYKKSEIPFYFIDNEKSHVNFIEEELSYEDEPDSQDGTYITGLLYRKDQHWGYGLYNDTRSEINIKGAYSRAFEDISEIKNNKSEINSNNQRPGNDSANVSADRVTTAINSIENAETKAKILDFIGTPAYSAGSSIGYGDATTKPNDKMAVEEYYEYIEGLTKLDEDDLDNEIAKAIKKCVTENIDNPNIKWHKPFVEKYVKKYSPEYYDQLINLIKEDESKNVER